MAASPETVSMAMFCDFENVALGVRDANYEKFDIKPVLERLLLKGSIVLKKAYCDWERYKGFKATMHEANFELIEIPHVRQSGKNSADIRMVVDALDLCYTKSHVNTFVIVSGDSDFSPLVSKLRENAKYVIGVGVKQSTSDLLIANCDEFIFYDDLVREIQRSAARRERATQPAPKRSHDESEARRKSEAIELALETLDALVAERGDTGKIWASMLKSAIKRQKPDFNEAYFGFRSFGALLEEAQSRGLLELGRDEKSGAFVSRSSASVARSEAHAAADKDADTSRPSAVAAPAAAVAAAPQAAAKRRSRGRGKGEAAKTQASSEPASEAAAVAQVHTPTPAEMPTPSIAATPPAADVQPASPVVAERRSRSRGKAPAKAAPESAPAGAAETVPGVSQQSESVAAERAVAEVVVAVTTPAEPAAAKKPASRSRRPRKPKAVAEG